MLQVRLQAAALDDLSEAYNYAARNAPEAAARWLTRFETALQSLTHNPQRCPLAIENPRSHRELREFHFGKRPFVFRVILTIDVAADVVWVLRIRRAQRRPLSSDDLGDSGF